MFMNERDKLQFKALINRSMDDCAFVYTRGQIIGLNRGGDLAQACAQLREWEARGLLKFLADPMIVGDDVQCVEMLDYIDKKSPWKTFPVRN